jgi:hypothetical protein
MYREGAWCFQWFKHMNEMCPKTLSELRFLQFDGSLEQQLFQLINSFMILQITLPVVSEALQISTHIYCLLFLTVSLVFFVCLFIAAQAILQLSSDYHHYR